jgi:hypothetical protein
MADNNKDASTPSASDPSAKAGDKTPTDPVEVAKDNLQQQKISGILRAVLDVPPVENADDKKLRYPWYVDVALGMGLLLAVGGFSLGLFKMYVTHKAQQCIIQGNYQAAIGLLKGSPVPTFGMTLHEEDPDQMLARALYLDARRKIEQNDIRGGLAELQQIRAGTDEFNDAQRILVENFTPSDTQLTGGVVQNELTTGGSK